MQVKKDEMHKNDRTIYFTLIRQEKPPAISLNTRGILKAITSHTW